MMSRLRLWWHRNLQFALVAGGVIIIFIAFALVVVFLGWDWTGFNGGYSKITMTAKGTIISQERQPTKTLWDWLQLAGVIAIPVAVAWFTTQQSHDLQIAAENQREAALQLYIDKMSELLLKEPKGELELVNRTIARARTLTVLSSLDKNRKRTVLQFLHESGLIDKAKPIIDLSYADLSSANLRGADLSGINLNNTNLRGANLSGTNLRGANLNGTNLSGADLREADLSGADLSGVNLSIADLSEAHLFRANLRGANLNGTNLSGADLREADLSGADLSGVNLDKANLDSAKIALAEREKSKSIKATNMSDGSKHS